MNPEEPEKVAPIVQRVLEKLDRARAACRPPETDAGFLLRQRALALARELSAPDVQTRLEVVEFRLGGQRLAFESAWVREIFLPRHLQPLPGAPPVIAGLVVLRGTVITVLDLRPLLLLPVAEATARPLVLLLAAEGKELGIAAEEVEGAEGIPLDRLARTPGALAAPAGRYLRGLLPGGVPLLDARLLLSASPLEWAAGYPVPADGGSS